MKKGNQLKKLFDRIIKAIPASFEFEEGEMPYFVGKDHPEYEGEETIVLGDDTAITFSSNRRFKIISMTEALFMPFETTENGVMEFYNGIWDAYRVLMIEDKSPSYQKGFLLTVGHIVEVLKSHQIER